MKLFGINLGKKSESKESTDSLRKSLDKYIAIVARHRAFLITMMVVLVLAITSLQMLKFTDPPVDETRAQENVSKLKRIKLDDNIVEQIKQLRDSDATASPNIDKGRTNPFSE